MVERGMPVNKPMYRDKVGFTLVELLIAISIFATVVATVYGAYRASFFTIKGSEHTLKSLAKAQVLIERISEDLTGIESGAEIWFEGAEEQGEEGILSFRSLAKMNIGKNTGDTGSVMVRYYLETDDDGEKKLYRESSSGQSAPDLNQGVVLCDGLKSFEIKYVSSDGQETDSWSLSIQRESLQGEDDGVELPALIKIAFELIDPDKEKSQKLYFRTAVALPKIY